MKVKSIIAGFLLSTICLSLCSCQNQVAMDDRMLIQAIGVDCQNEKTMVTIQYNQAKEGEDGKVTLVQSTGESTMDALSNASLSIGKKPLYSHNMVVVFGKDCAQAGLYKVLDFFVRQQETRPSVSVFIADGTAEKILSTRNDNDEVIRGKDISSLSMAGRWNGEAMRAEVLDVVNQLLNEGSSPSIPVLKSEEKSIHLNGTAFFQEDTIKGFLNKDETRGVMLILGKLQTGTEVVESEENGKVTLHINKSKSKIEVAIKEGIPHFKINIEAIANISAIDHSMERNMSDNFYDKLETLLKEVLEKKANSAIDLCVIKNSCDIFSFGRRVMAKDTSYWKKNCDNWPELMKQSKYDVTVKANIRHVGQEIMPAPT